MATTINDFETAYGITFQEWLSIGGEAGDFMKKYYKWEEDPIAFHQTQPIPYFAVYNEFAEKEQNSQAMPAVNAELARIEKQKEDKDPKKPGYFKMGTVELTIPPIQISVSDIKHNTEYKTLRTKSDIIFQSGKSTKVIELDIYFHNIDEINNKLRPLLAQLKCVPFIPIYSDYLKTVLDPDGPNTTKKLVGENGEEVDFQKEVRETNSKIEKSRTALREKLRKNQGLMSSKPNLIQHLNDYWNSELDPLNTSKLDAKKSLAENIDNMLIEAGVAENAADKNSIKYQTLETEKTTSDLRTYLNEQFNNVSSVRDEGNLVGVLSQISVGTVAGFPESLACHISMFLFNYMPFSKGFEFADSENNATLDIDKCTYFVQWYASRFLEDKDERIGQFYKPLEKKMNGKVSLWYLIGEGIPSPMVETDSDSVCSSIMVVQRNSIAFLPVLQWSVPTCQYMGAHNSQVLMTFDTIDNSFIDRLRDMLDQVEAKSRNDVKSRRENFITVENELVQFMGIRNCAVQKIDTATVEGSPGMTRITLTLTEFDVRQLTQETIKKNVEYSDIMAREFFRADLKDYLEDPNNANKDFRKMIERDIMYKTAAGWGVNYSPGKLNKFIENDERLRNSTLNVIKEYYRENAGTNKTVITDVRGRGLIDENKVTIKENPTDDSYRWYNVTDMENVGKFMKNKVLTTTDVDALDNDTIDCILWNNDYTDKYKSDVYDKIDSYLKGHSVNLPENVRSRFEEEGLTTEESRPITVYPDMDLPTYNDTKRVGEGAEKPTYTRLGTRNPTLKQYESPRIDSDTVEPDFCFYYFPLTSTTYLWNSDPISFWGKMADGVDMFFEDFKKLTQQDIPDAVSNAIEKLQFNHMSTMDIDDLLNEAAAEENDKQVEKEQNAAAAKRDSIQSESLTPTSSEEWYRFNEENEQKTLSLTPEGLTIYDRFKIYKQYTDPTRGLENDSGKNVYGGIMPDSSIYEELEDNGQSLGN
jgi:hypothetical protein